MAKINSKFPKIIIDSRQNTHLSKSMQRKISIEEYYDLLHHTHNISDLIQNNEIGTDENIQLTIANLVNTVNELKSTISKQQETIDRLSSLVEINEDNDVDVTDWDITKEGIQDINGNTIG